MVKTLKTKLSKIYMMMVFWSVMAHLQADGANHFHISPMTDTIDFRQRGGF